MGRQPSIPKEYVCEVCQTTMPIPRKRGHLRGASHKKSLYCFKCQRLTIHEEKSEYITYNEA